MNHLYVITIIVSTQIRLHHPLNNTASNKTLTHEYSRIENSFCGIGDVSYGNLKDAKSRCSRELTCQMLYDVHGKGTTFRVCVNTTYSDNSSRNDVLYIKKGPTNNNISEPVLQDSTKSPNIATEGHTIIATANDSSNSDKGCKTEDGRKCIFPFIYNRKTFYNCTWEDAIKSKSSETIRAWCSTKINTTNRNHIEDIGAWGVCREGCPIPKAPNFETYSCGWWHCDFKQKDENKIWGKYENTSVDCSTCQDRCTADNNCTAVECNNNAREECIWVKIDMCGTKDKRVHNKSYMTCEKSPSEPLNMIIIVMSITLGVMIISFGIGVIWYRVCRNNNTNLPSSIKMNAQNYELDNSPTQERYIDNSPMLRKSNPDSHIEYVVNQSDKLRSFAHLNRRLTGKYNEFNPNGDIKSQVRNLSYDTKREISKNSFNVGDEIGSGNFGKVYKGDLFGLTRRYSKTTVAIKYINGGVNEKEMDTLLDEMKIMSNVKPHLNLVSMIGSCTSELEERGKLWILLEFCEHGDLKQYLVTNKDNILADKNGTRRLLKWAYDIANGMQYLAENNIMHGDLAARNVLMDENPLEENCPVAKVADFGLSKKFYDNVKYEKETRVFVPWKWMAIEYLTKDYFTLTSDVWSFGVLFWELFSFGRNPYGHQDYDELIRKLINGYRLQCPEEVRHITDWSPATIFKQIAEACFERDPIERASFSDVLKIIEKDLMQNEVEVYKQMKHIYETTCADNYGKLGRQ